MIIARIVFPLPAESKDGISNMEISLPRGARVVGVQFVPPSPARLRLIGFDPGAPLLLFIALEPEATEKETRRFIRWPDQAPFKDGVGDYVGTAMRYVGESALEVTHVFELPVMSSIVMPGGVGRPS